jgi:hypothetical protein
VLIVVFYLVAASAITVLATTFTSHITTNVRKYDCMSQALLLFLMGGSSNDRTLN